MSKDEKKALLESLLFIENEPVEYSLLSKHTGLEQPELSELIEELKTEYEFRKSGLQIVEVAGGCQMIAHPRFGLILSQIYGVKNTNKLSQTALEVLAIIAYKQPITKTEIENIRGVSCERVLKQVLEKDLITIKGRRETPGKPLEFGTTKKFLKVFSLKSIDDLPKLREIKEMEFELRENSDNE